jgi:hypothetical protein
MSRFIALFFLFLPSLAVSQTVQTITGRIYDEASGAPLEGAVVVVTDLDPPKGGAADSLGFFKIEGVTIGRHTFKVSYASYEPKTLYDVDVTAGKQVNLNIALQEAVRTLKEVTITYDRSKDKNRTNNDMTLVSARTFNVDETKRYAGSFGDPSRMAANFAGVIAGNDSRNDIVVRGNAPTGMLWQIEGLNAPNPNHFGTLNSTGGPVSILNNNNIDKSDFLTGAFPAQYGNALAGVFDIRLREGNRQKAEYVAQVGFNGFEGGAEGPIGKNKKTSYLINYRYSTLTAFKALGLNVGTGTAVPIYQDVNYKIVSRINKKSKISLFGLAGLSEADFLGKDIDTAKPDLYGGDPFANQRTKFATTINGLTYDWQVTEKSNIKLIAGYSTTYQRYLRDSISEVDRSEHPSEVADFKTGKASLQAYYQHKFNAKNNLLAGFTYENTAFNTLYKTMSPGKTDRVFNDQTGNMGLHQAFGQWKHRFSNALSMVAGVHLQYLDLNDQFAIEPRLGFRYTANPRNAFSLGYGMHNQAQNVYSYFVLTPTATGYEARNRNLDFTRSQHIVASYDHSFSSYLRIKVESYLQLIDQVPVERFASSYSALNSGATFTLDNTGDLVNKGVGRNYGAEFTIERFLNKGFYLLGTLSLINSSYKGSDNVWRYTGFNTEYATNLLAGKEFKVGKKKNILGINARISRIGGRYLTPIDAERSKLTGNAEYINEQANSLKQTDYFRTDLKISYKKEYRRSTLEVSLDLQNITNNKNVFSQNFDRRTGRVVYNYQQGFLPVPFFRFTF